MRIKKIIFLSLFFVFACSTSSKNPPALNKTDLPTPSESPISPEEMKDYCDKGSYIACYTLAHAALEEKKWSKALTLFEENCEKNFHAYSCTQAGYLKRSQSNDIKAAVNYSEKACQMMDALGCYNLACYQCLQQQKEVALQSLQEAERVGFKFTDKAANDPDLACLKEHPELKRMIQEGKTKNQARTSPYHIFFPSYSLAMIPPTLFSWDGSSTIVFTDTSGAFVQPLIYAQAYENSLKQYRQQNKNDKSLKIQEGDSNGYKVFIGQRKMDVNGRTFKEYTFFTGDQNYTVGAVGNYPEDFEKMLGENILRSLMTIVYKPIMAPPEESLPFTSDSKKLGFRFGGYFNTSAVFHYDGDQDKIPNPRVFVHLVNYKNEESFKKEKPESFCKENEVVKVEKPFTISPLKMGEFRGITCENTVVNETLSEKIHIRGWVLSRKKKNERLVVQSIDDETQNHRQLIEKFVRSLKIKK